LILRAKKGRVDQGQLKDDGFIHCSLLLILWFCFAWESDLYICHGEIVLL